MLVGSLGVGYVRAGVCAGVTMRCGLGIRLADINIYLSFFGNYLVSTRFRYVFARIVLQVYYVMGVCVV